MARSLHGRIRADIEDRILSGEWGPGTRLPVEHDLMARYDCARMTVNKVMSQLVDAGLLERRRRAGTFVRSPAVQSAVLQIPDIKQEVEASGRVYNHVLVRQYQRKASARELQAGGLAASTSIVALQCCHRADGRPIAFEDRIISLDAVPEARVVDFAAEPPGTWLLHHVPWHEAEHHISARPAGRATAKLLEMPQGAACLVLERRTWRAGRLITAVTVWYPGDRQRLVARFRPRAGA